MPLLNFWKSNRQDVLKLNIEQIVSNAGDGILKDESSCCSELRSFFRIAPSDSLFAYARHCLEISFNKSGLVLQDVINEFGRRLDFEVEDGLYQGKKNSIGHDGLWRSKDQSDIVVEVKTTDYVTMSLEKLAKYKERLLLEDKVQREAAMLIVVGREDTGALEAQVRGSRYAWEMRLISVESLIKLVQIKEKSDDPATIRQIRQLLQPFEYTKIDGIIDVIFTTAVDVESSQTAEQSLPPAAADSDSTFKQERTDSEHLNAKRDQAVNSFAALRGQSLLKRSRTLFSSPDKEFRVCCAVSKRYDSDYQPYWYAFHPTWDEFLAGGKESFFLLSCMDRDEAFAVPYSFLQANKNNLNMTDRGEKSYWHIALNTLGCGELAINVSKIGKKVSLEPYRFAFSANNATAGSTVAKDRLIHQLIHK
jgi:hypothetical protein